MAREDIDPRREDVARRPRKRRHRAKPDPNPAMAAEKPKALAQALKRPVAPGIMFEHENSGYVAVAPHSDSDLWDLQIARTFGTRSQSVMRVFLEQLNALCTMAWDEANGAWKPNESELCAILAMITDLAPRNTAEAAMAAQMVVVHLMTMKLGKQALNGGGMIMERDAALTGKLAHRYAMMMDTYQALRGKRRTSRQTITVRKETHYHQHLHPPGLAENSGRPHGTDAGEPTERAALPGPEPRGQVVRLASRARPRRV
ncbi:MAG: hypothetical protein ABIU18_08255 [Novosphingobium sp.]